MPEKISFLRNTKLEEKAITRIENFVTAIRGARKEREKEWDKYYKTWKSKEAKTGDTAYAGRARTFNPFGHRAVEVFASRTPGVLFGGEDVVKIVNPKDQSPLGLFLAQLNTAKLRKQFKKNKQSLKWKQFIRNMAIYGTAVAGVSWRYDTREVYYKDREFVADYDTDGNIIGEHPIEIDRIKEVDVYDAPDMRNIDLKDWFIDPKAKSIDDASFVVERTRMNYNQLWRLAKRGVFDESRVKKLRPEGEGEEYTRSDNTFPDIENDERFDTTGFSSVDFSEKPIEVFEYWGLFEVKPGVEVEVVITMADKELIRFQRNPFFHQKKPYIAAAYIEDDQSFYGVSMLEPVYLDIIAANTIKNQAIDRTTQNLNNMWLRLRSANIKNEQLKFRPNGVIDTHVMGGLTPLRPDPGSLADAQRMLEYTDRSVQETTGATKMLAGTETDILKQSTAFAIKSNKTESTVKFAAILDTILVSAVRPYFSMCQDLNAQFCDEEDNVEVLGPQGRLLYTSVRPEDILSDYDVDVYAGEDLVQESYQVQNIISYLNWILQMIPVQQQLNPGQQIMIPDINALAKQVWEKMGFKESLPVVSIQAPIMPLAGAGQNGGQLGNEPQAIPGPVGPMG